MVRLTPLGHELADTATVAAERGHRDTRLGWPSGGATVGRERRFGTPKGGHSHVGMTPRRLVTTRPAHGRVVTAPRSGVLYLAGAGAHPAARSTTAAGGWRHGRPCAMKPDRKVGYR